MQLFNFKYSRTEMISFIIVCSIFPLYLSMFRYGVFGALVRLSDLLLLTLVAIKLLTTPKVFYNFAQVKIIPVWLYIGYILTNGVYNDNLSSSIKECIQLLWIMTYFIIASSYAKKNSRLFLELTIVFLIISATYTMLYHFSEGHLTRYKSANDGKYAFGLLSLLLLLKSSMFSDRQAFKVFLISLIPLFMSMERKGIFGVILIFILLGVIKLIKVKPSLGEMKLLLLSGFLIAGSMLYLFDISAYIDYKIYQSNFLDEGIALYTSNVHRENLLVNAYQIISEHPLLGVGSDQITYYMFDYYWDERLINGAHNFYLDMLVQYGTIGLLFLLTWSFYNMYSCYKSGLYHKELFLFYAYCIFVVTFMAVGQAVMLVFFMPFLNPNMFLNHD
ncbi:O-antigen ligase family protein [Pseudoalteromonas distincta]|jgi:O-antigen ligase|uniref:O-antigen ligase family protein n=1 Tax=Pseudoalteromonas TaxID=53246 RepID=UPI001196C3F8|nr:MULTISPECIES: O-antigen ligase family protein [Pseudoalteromonas]MBG9991702.1 O-antigen ligase family protein [Pseudoalteromonas sp. NZS37]TVU77499.1 O-antigen ligase family protein [Pseudoalteromonas elyakovii]|tara:strand:- start:1937 stop:3103 length:1167 start_codon:yes stop_codon:yes gene_type:complete